MLDIILIFAGAATLLNGVNLLGKVPHKELAIINILVGFLQFFVFFIFFFTSDKADPYFGFNLCSVLLFSFTYLFLGFNNLMMDHTGKGVGAYCLWVAFIAFGFGLVCLFPQKNLINAIKWFEWTYLWFLFFYISKNAKFIIYTGWVAVIVALHTLIIPSFLSLTLFWKYSFVQNTWIFATLLVIIFLVISPLFTIKKREEKA